MDKILQQEDAKIYITGATGWVGRSVLHELQGIIPERMFNNRVYAFGSKEGLIKATNYSEQSNITIPIKPLSEIKKYQQGSAIKLIHTAFLTRDRIPGYGIKRFIEKNQNITRIVADFLKESKEARVVNISSGAAEVEEKRGTKSLEQSKDPYGYLKLTEENILGEIAVTQSLRIYGLTGRFIRTPERFAIGDLIIRAIKGEILVINSPFAVIRSYASASDIAKCAIRWQISEEEPIKPIGASSHITTLESLAEKIARYFSLPNPITKEFKGTPNSYSCSPVAFDKMLMRYKMRSKPLDDQIIDTVNGINERH